MGRPRLRAGAHGTVKTRKLPGTKIWESATYVRDADGHRRYVRRTADTKGGAETKLQDALGERTGFGRELSGDTTIEAVSQRWLKDYTEMVDTAERAPNTLRVYSSVLDKHVIPGVGALRLSDADVTRLEHFILATRKHHGASVTKTARTVLNGIMGYAARHGAITTNPMRDVSRVAGGAKRKPRSLTAAERAEWQQRIKTDQKACDRDIPDLTLFLLATGVRISEALGLSFQEVSFADETVAIDFQIIRVKGKGLRRMRTKTKAGERTLRLPGWAMTMLARRYAALGEGPVFPSMRARSWRDPSNTDRDFRQARDKAGFEWVTPHVFRKTVATILDEAKLSAREIADQMGHTRLSMTQDVYMGRGMTTQATADALDAVMNSEP